MRARNLKPSLFTNELLAVSDPLNTVVFTGLWCLADREGRLEDRPAKIHLAVNPGRALGGTESALDWLNGKGFILRYVNKNNSYIQIVNFHRHQHPHPNEKPSEIPEPTECNTKVISASDLGETDSISNRASSLIPSSLNPSSLNPEAPKGARRCPEDFSPDLSFAENLLPDINAKAEAGRFKDYEFKTPRKDWGATWRNWIRTCKDTGKYARKDAIKWV